MLVAFAARAPRFESLGRLTAEWRPWAAKLWRFSTTIGFGKIFQPGARDSATIVQHEEIHSRQIEDLMLLSLVVGSVAACWDWRLGLGVYLSGGVWQLPNFIAAWLRGERPYRDSEHERSAYAQAGSER